MHIATVMFQVVIAYVVADAIAGMYHFATDRGWNIPSQLAFFRQHHERPWTMTFDLQPVIAGIPIAAAGWWFSSAFLVALGVFLSVAQVPHYYSHFPAPSWAKLLQRTGIIISPESHNRHHTAPHDRDYCVLSGWNNWWINWLASRIDGT